MGHYTLLLFNPDDGVAVVRTVVADSDQAAQQIAKVAQLAHSGCVGYQLWRAGNLIAKTFPVGRGKQQSDPQLVARS
jgi:hypothetical protein